MIKREIYMSRIRPFIGNELIKVLTGIRRAGKSVMLELIKEEIRANNVNERQFITFNFEDMNNSAFLNASSLHDEIIRRSEGLEGKVYLFFDEIQEVDSWERCINSIRLELDADIYITGSNAKLLSSEIATLLSGRYVEFVIYPFSFSEFIELYREVYSDSSKKECFSAYLKFGGMPYLANLRYSEEPCKQYLMDLFSSVQLKDIVQHNHIRDAELLEKVLLYIIGNIGSIFTSLSISRFFKSEKRSASVDTIMNFVRYCEEAFLIYRAKRQDLKGKQMLATYDKLYMADHGIREALFGSNHRDINLELENIVYMESIRRGYSVSIGRIGDKEIDFVLDRSGKRIYLQVSYLLASEDTVQREFGAFENISDNYPKYVLSLDEFDFSRSGIIHKNLIDFILSDAW